MLWLSTVLPMAPHQLMDPRESATARLAAVRRQRRRAGRKPLHANVSQQRATWKCDKSQSLTCAFFLFFFKVIAWGIHNEYQWTWTLILGSWWENTSLCLKRKACGISCVEACVCLTMSSLGVVVFFFLLDLKRLPSEHRNTSFANDSWVRHSCTNSWTVIRSKRNVFLTPERWEKLLSTQFSEDSPGFF